MLLEYYQEIYSEFIASMVTVVRSLSHTNRTHVDPCERINRCNDESRQLRMLTFN